MCSHVFGQLPAFINELMNSIVSPRLPMN